MDEEKFVPLDVIDKTEFNDDEFPDEFGNKKSELSNISIDEIIGPIEEAKDE